ncbi:unnamed protein product [Allacma fusca]|uniref:SCP domain-containing protein n=1 Tax=Allacma fusca TaxID=39272 RepID=A0A8J2NHS4_9HEXA|nr:unnamed protein product [Allacma fusca]
MIEKPSDAGNAAEKRDKYQEGMIAAEVLAAHNHYRSNHSAPPLALDQNLSIQSQNWADELLRQNRIIHSPLVLQYGENIFHAHVKQNIPPKRCVKSWYKEEQKYDWDNIGHQKGTGHFTQLIWKGSRILGVGYATSLNGGTFLVCNYDPPGNTEDNFAANVLPPKTRTTLQKVSSSI